MSSGAQPFGRKVRVAVLGAFDTWPYMNYVAERVASTGAIAHTIRFTYLLGPAGRIGRYPYRPDEFFPMNAELEDLITLCKKAIVIYSVPAGHYNEAHWCAHKRKPTLGLALVRGIRVTDVDEKAVPNCKNLHVSPKGLYSQCCPPGRWTGWRCIRSATCPFKKQGISLNQLDYYVTRRYPMRLFAIERIQDSDYLVPGLVHGQLPPC